MNLCYKDRRRFSKATLLAFFEITKLWKLNVKEKMRLLGIKSFQDLGKRRQGKVVLSNSELERLGWVFNIQRNLYILFSNSKQARNNWMKKKNQAPLFGGKSAMEYIMESDLPAGRILNVRNYLQHQAGTEGW